MDATSTCSLDITIKLNGLTSGWVEEIRNSLLYMQKCIDQMTEADPYMHASIVVEGTKRETYTHHGAY